MSTIRAIGVSGSLVAALLLVGSTVAQQPLGSEPVLAGTATDQTGPGRLPSILETARKAEARIKRMSGE